MTPRLDAVADAMVAAYTVAIDSYASVRAGTAIHRDVWGITRMHLGMLFPVVVGDKPELEPADIASLRLLGARRAEQGVSLHAVLQAYQVGTQVAWKTLLAELTAFAGTSPLALETSGLLGTAILAATAQASEEVTRAYMAARGRAATSGERTRRALFEELIRGGGDDEGSLRRRAHALGYRLGRTHVVVAAGTTHPPPPADPVGSADHRRMMLALDALRPTGAPPLVDTDGDLVVAVVVVDSQGSTAQLAHQVHRQLHRQAASDQAALVASVADPVDELAAIPTSYRQARRTLDITRAVREPGSVTTYAEMLPYLVVSQDRGLAADLVAHSVGPLLDRGTRPGGRSPLVDTLRVYLAEGGSLGRTAAHMHVHRHTVSARLARIERVTGVSLDDPNGLLRLQFGLCAADVMASPTLDRRSRSSPRTSTNGP
jgi:sugar diacid utilization regulator